MAGDIADPCIATSESKQMLSTLLLTNNLPSMVVLADVGSLLLSGMIMNWKDNDPTRMFR